jgi:hypothetical protein
MSEKKPRSAQSVSDMVRSLGAVGLLVGVLATFVWFTRTQEFRLLVSDREHLHNDITIKIFNPYGEYWRKKYIKWFKENINVETLDKFDPFIHKH